MKIALGQINTTVGDFGGNVEKILDFARRAKARGAELVVYPELALCGYPPRDLVEKSEFVRRSETELRRLASLLPDIFALVGYVRRSQVRQGKGVADAAALLGNGQVLADYAKVLLPFYDVFDESRYFEPGPGPVVCQIHGTMLGITICEDAWNDKSFWAKPLYARNPVEETVSAGAGVLVNIASSPYCTDKIQLRHDMLRALACQHRVPVVYVNHVGGNDQLIFDGSSMAFDAQGTLCARGKSFEEDLILFDTDGACGEIRPALPSQAGEVYQALLLGTRDYVSKCGFQKVLVGLSGGIDSSLVATIAADALGAENVTGIGMPGPYSSSGSLRDAEALARNLKIDFRVIPITPIFESYLTALDPAFEGRPLDVTEENIQARIRGNILMALSNKFGALLLTTGNKSELAVGYCTLYGDMAGGLAVIADVPKTMVYELARYANHTGERIPQACLAKAPSAELRPNQTDQDTLPPYDILDTILRAYIEMNLTASDIAASHNLALDLVRETIRKVNQAEYKRQQAPPALKVTAKAFGMGRRYPIAQKFSE
jgi:NAD+ synthase (glutamine-hydrolysing)